MIASLTSCSTSMKQDELSVKLLGGFRQVNDKAINIPMKIFANNNPCMFDKPSQKPVQIDNL